MVYAAHMRAAFSTAARRDQILSDIQNRFLGKPRWDADATVCVAADLRGVEKGITDGQFGIIFDCTFTARQDADELLARVQAFATGQRQPVAGSWLAIHDCDHDTEDAPPCVIDPADRVVW